ncbi:uncharacterized protein Z518_10761 [Rhinocladiella mackenziei CBS 650.93]|uniref:DUF7102 domain-containing protein n=1 Tax=Rhinocladiella mackenziei CBS 650.93 TaxID=1442369 RepID=A0A0D2I254_9EURO|nr:uncharacterized protein Z518_10761 [Rhinocladiella mackenziei CBS 650.93]KIW99833.1 hypothetical protein Z518_10761 [Rhinocladiella mackenziei CBS 650.93]
MFRQHRMRSNFRGEAYHGVPGYGIYPKSRQGSTLKPGAGLIFTNTQALNQKNLPGQSSSGNEGTIQNQIIGLVQDYDRFFVMVIVPGSGGQLLQAILDIIDTFKDSAPA